MVVYKRCNRKIVHRSVSCRECKNHCHPGCVLGYVVNKPADSCCARSFEDTVQRSDQSVGTVQKTTSCAANSRDRAFNESRNLSNVGISSDLSDKENVVPESRSEMGDLPEGWGDFTPAEQFAALFKTMGAKSGELNERFKELSD
ncbi:hypothetical protein QAD02_012845 [Eretmocerus hayati]|uniref:Uncharacterized protein n=1 Tax=Eretmocerus hayati TaxID=131215 RepID=A0ACC2P1T4_9HYME|nr:hypothetical protein QAD02_012845 [Eretmocerus hayati]